MKRFLELINEKKDHIIKKMPNLSDEEKAVLINFFKKKPNLESKIDWNKWRKLTFADFADVMKETKTEKKRKLQKARREGLKGLKKNKDYIELRTNNKNYDVYIPLNPKAARVIASVHIGGCWGKWCLANTQATKYYKSEAKRKHMIPIMVVGDNEKYTVMMFYTGKVWEVWDSENERPMRGEPIPGFSIKKELTTPKLLKLYDEIVHKIWPGQIPPTPKGVDTADYKMAVSDYEDMIDDVVEYLEDIKEKYENYIKSIEDERQDVIETLKDEIDAKKDELDLLFREIEVDEKRRDIVNKVKDVVIHNPQGTGYNRQGEEIWEIGGKEYDRNLIDKLLDIAHNVDYDELISEKEEEIKNKEEEIDEMEYYLEEIENMDTYEFLSWSLETSEGRKFGDIYDVQVYEYEPDIFRNVPDLTRSYTEYFDFMEKNGVDIDRDALQSIMYDMEGEAWYETIDEEDIKNAFSYENAVHPSEIDTVR